MSIQSNINQITSLASLLLTQSPAAKFRKEGLAFEGTRNQAEIGLKDIEKNLRREELTAKSKKESLTAEEQAELTEKGGPKEYIAEELENIGSRAEQYQKDLYDVKSASLNPRYSRYINEGMRQPEISKTLENIYSKKKAAQERIAAANEEKKASEKLITNMMEGAYYRKET